MSFNQRATVIRPGSKAQRAGSPVDDWSDSAVTRIPIRSGVKLQPTTQSETLDELRDIAVGTWFLRTPRGVDIDIRSTDRVSSASMVFEVVGNPLRHPDPLRPGRVHHVTVNLREVRT